MVSYFDFLVFVSGERPYSCDLCPRAFTTRGNLRTHYSSVHHRELPPASSSAKRSNGTKAKDKLSCPICSCICDNNDVLSQHMQLHVTKDQNLLALHQCLQQSGTFTKIGFIIYTQSTCPIFESIRFWFCFLLGSGFCFWFLVVFGFWFWFQKNVFGSGFCLVLVLYLMWFCFCFWFLHLNRFPYVIPQLKKVIMTSKN